MKRIIAGLALLCTPLVLPAQWAFGPGGDLEYTLQYSTSATFSCSWVMIPGSCLASGSSLVLTNGTANATITFAGVTNTITATNLRTGGMGIGAFQIAYGGTGAFDWPPAVNPFAALFGTRIAMTQIGPKPETTFYQRQFRLQSPGVMFGDCCDGAGNYIVWGVTPPPTGAKLAIVVDTFSPLLFTAGGTSFEVTAAIGVVPDPSTWALMLAGLAAIGIVAKRRRV